REDVPERLLLHRIGLEVPREEELLVERELDLVDGRRHREVPCPPGAIESSARSPSAFRVLCLHVSPEQIRQWMAGRRSAARRECVEQHALPPQEAVRRGLGVIAFVSRIHGWPVPETEADRREDRAAYAR